MAYFTSGYFKILLLSGVIATGAFTNAFGQFSYSNTPLIDIIKDVEEQTDYSFLYRNALISDINLSFSTEQEELFSDFSKQLESHQLALKVDEERKQAIIIKLKTVKPQATHVQIKGQVLDANTGERLPYAVITWKEQGTLKGLSTNESGNFYINQRISDNEIEITGSFFGYSKEHITLNLQESGDIDELTFRLQPERLGGNQLLVTGFHYYDNINEYSAGVLDIGTFSPMGEGNTTSALQMLPSVSIAPALSGDINIRGSSADALKVMIDDITIYNKSHLFGLIDSFNSDVLKRSGFYYDVAPLKYQAPPGGTLSLITKTGSLDKFSGTAGLSNSSFRLSLEGPIQTGKSSWLFSARKSYMDAINWFNNYKLVQWGLDVDRKQGTMDNSLIDLQPYLEQPGKTGASFFDMHGKFYVEGKNGSRLIVSGYYGGDDTKQKGQRLFSSFSTPGSNNFQYQNVATTNDWQNGAGSVSYQRWLSDQVFSSTVLGASIYKTTFTKDDFTYLKVNNTDQSLQAFTFPFLNESVLNEFKAKQVFDYNLQQASWSGGLSYNYYLGEYYESSFDRPGYFKSTGTHKMDIFGQFDYSDESGLMNVFTGMRLHYYSEGEYVKWSPRLKIKMLPESILSFSAGFSRNHQFVNQISLTNAVTSNVWILADKDQPPTSVNYFTAGAYFNPTDYFYLQAEAYRKDFEHVRLHEINAFSLSRTFESNPWFVNNEGTSKGIEFLGKTSFSIVEFTQTLTFSEVTLTNPDINNGDPFYADWDRRVRTTSTLGIKPTDAFSFYVAWNYASGTPNKISGYNFGSSKRLDNYRRMDISAEYILQQEKYDLTVSASVFNVLGRNNPWYRDLGIAIDQNATPNRFVGTPVDVYDIGVQPSFNIKIGF